MDKPRWIKGKKEPSYSIRRRISAGIIFVFALFSFLTVGEFYYFTSIIRTQTYSSLKNTLQLFNQQTDKEFSSMDTYLYGILTNNNDIAILEENREDTGFYISIENIHSALQNALPSFPTLQGMFVFSKPSQTFISYSSQSSATGCDDYLKQLLRSSTGEIGKDKINLQKWNVQSINGTFYLYRVIRFGSCYVGAWTSVDNLLSAFHSDSETKTMIVGKDGTVEGNNEFSGIRLNPVETQKSYRMVKAANGISYLMISQNLSSSDYYLTTLVSGKSLSEQMRFTQYAILIIGVFILLLGLFLTFTMSHYLSQPLKSMLTAIDSLREGNFNSKIMLGSSTGTEFQQVESSFNDMVDAIKELKINVYEEQLDRKKAELLYLKSQVAPHFLINCLNTIYSLSASPESRGIIQEMTVTLSNHLRYTLSGRTKVSLAEELHYVENYLELSNLRFPGCMCYTPDIDPQTKDAAVFPMLILMFAENIVTHELVMGEILHVSVISHLIETETAPRIHLTITDSGDGFSSNFLEAVKEPGYAQKDENGHHIGIKNTIGRLQNLYGDEAEIKFSNEAGSGARIDIEIPYSPF